MGSRPKYTEGRRMRKVILGQEFLTKLETEDQEVMDGIMETLEEMKNDIEGYTKLGFTFIGPNRKARFVVFKFVELNSREVKLYRYDEISSDDYLDMLLVEQILTPHIDSPHLTNMATTAYYADHFKNTDLPF